MTDPGLEQRVRTHFGVQGVRAIGGLPYPLEVGPYFRTDPDDPVQLGEYAESVGAPLSRPELADWTRLGLDGGFELCVDPAGAVQAVTLVEDEPARFVNSGAEQLVSALLGLDRLLDAVSAASSPDRAAAAFRAFEAQLAEEDSAAVADGAHWWPQVLDDVRDTCSVSSYAAFEYLDANGEKQIVTRSGGPCVHPEERLWEALEAAGVDSGQVTRVYTELQACYLPGHYCSLWLSRLFPEAALTYSFPYGDTQASRAEGIRALLEATAAREGQ
jgi:hypothetical protein